MTDQDQLLAFIARLCLVLIFPFSALSKVFDYPSAMAQAAHGWIPLPSSAATFLLVLGGMLELVGPPCILFGFYRRQAALLFIVYVIATAVLFHNFWSFPFYGDAWSEFLAIPKKLWLGGRISLYRDRRQDALTAPRILL